MEFSKPSPFKIAFVSCFEDRSRDDEKAFQRGRQLDAPKLCLLGELGFPDSFRSISTLAQATTLRFLHDNYHDLDHSYDPIDFGLDRSDIDRLLVPEHFQMN